MVRFMWGCGYSVVVGVSTWNIGDRASAGNQVNKLNVTLTCRTGDGDEVGESGTDN